MTKRVNPVIVIMSDCRHGKANIATAESYRYNQLQLVSSGCAKTHVVGLMGHKHADRRQQTEAAVIKAQRVNNKKGFCEICKVHFNDMKTVCRLKFVFFAFYLVMLLTVFAFYSMTVLIILCLILCDTIGSHISM